MSKIEELVKWATENDAIVMISKNGTSLLDIKVERRKQFYPVTSNYPPEG